GSRRGRMKRSYERSYTTSRSATPSRGHEPALADAEPAFDEQRERRGGDRTREQHGVVVQREPGDDALAVAAGADERGDGGGADIDHGRGLDARQYGRGRERQLDLRQDRSRPHAQRLRGLDHAARYLRECGV